MNQRLWLYLNFGIPATLALVSGISSILKKGDRKMAACMAVCLLWFPFFVALDLFLHNLGRIEPLRLDGYVYRIDAAFGSPGFLLAQFIGTQHWLDIACRFAYETSVHAMLLVVVYVFFTRTLQDTAVCLRTIATANLAILVYIACPVSGPLYTIPGYPEIPAHVPLTMVNRAAPNGVPSIHLTMALLFVWFLRHSRIGTVLAYVFVVLTVGGTLVTGEHFVFDLVLAFPFTALLIYLNVDTRLKKRHRFTVSELELRWAWQNSQWKEEGTVLDVRFLSPGKWEIETNSEWIARGLAKYPRSAILLDNN